MDRTAGTGSHQPQPTPHRVLEPADRERLIDYLVELGATRDELEAADDHLLGATALELTLRGAGERLPFDDAVTQAGLGRDEAARLWRALGFPDPTATAIALSPDEVETLRLMSATSRELMGEEATIALARVVGATTARLADAVVNSFRTQVEVPQRASGTPYSDIVRSFSAVARDLLPSFLEAFGVVFRGHLVAVAAGTWTPDEEGATAGRDVAVLFVDLVGYTPLSHTLSTRQLASLVDRFEEALSEHASAHHARVVKLIGDGAMLVADDAAAACALALDLVECFDADPDLPALRVTVAAGQVMTRSGDYYGDVVNLASRLMTVTAPSTVVASESVRDRAGQGFTFTPAGSSRLKGYDAPAPSYVVRRD